MLNKKKNNKGFTLVELLVVIAIIGILAVVAVPALFKNINKAKVADLESDYSAIKSAVLSYYTDNNELPITTPKQGQVEAITWNTKLANYMDSVPTHSPLKGTYDLELVNTKLYLTISGANITEEQLKKLNQDIGSNKIEVATKKSTPLRSSEGTHNDYETVDNNESNLKGEGVNIRIVLIENTNM